MVTKVNDVVVNWGAKRWGAEGDPVTTRLLITSMTKDMAESAIAPARIPTEKHRLVSMPGARDKFHVYEVWGG